MEWDFALHFPVLVHNQTNHVKTALSGIRNIIIIIRLSIVDRIRSHLESHAQMAIYELTRN